MSLKGCNKCKSTKKKSNFHKDASKRDGLSSICKPCASEKNQKYHQRNQQKRNLQNKEWYSERKDQERKRAKNKWLKRRYDLSPEDYLSMQKTQLSCEICCRVFSKENPPCVGHDHITGKVRSLLCRSCNAGIGLFREDPLFLKSAILYLKKWNR